jgi:TetR/AcrR family transcriptional regulator
MPPRKQPKRRPKTTPREHLLHTAITLFSRRGYDGASVNEIVDLAGVSKRMVYHYFKSKALLYQETLFYAYNELRSYEQAAIADATSLEDAVKKLIRVYFGFPREHPKLSHLMRWENINDGRALKDTHFPLSKEVIVTRLEEIIRQDADGIKWRSDLKAPLLLITIIGNCQVYVSHRYTLSQGLNIDLGTAAAIKRGIANAEHYILAGMRPS